MRGGEMEAERVWDLSSHGLHYYFHLHNMWLRCYDSNPHMSFYICLHAISFHYNFKFTQVINCNLLGKKLFQKNRKTTIIVITENKLLLLLL